jgi:hypothetical protein
MTHKTIDYARIGVGACEAFREGPAAFADFVRTILSVATPLHAHQNGNDRQTGGNGRLRPIIGDETLTERNGLRAELTVGGYVTSRGRGLKIELND